MDNDKIKPIENILILIGFVYLIFITIVTFI
jgi:hypothetical protein